MSVPTVVASINVRSIQVCVHVFDSCVCIFKTCSVHALINEAAVGSCSVRWVVCGSLSFNWKIIWCFFLGVPQCCVPTQMPACSLTSLWVHWCLRECVDYELPSGVMRKNRSITRYAQEHRSTAEREERLSYKMTFWLWRAKLCGWQRRRQRRTKTVTLGQNKNWRQ